MELLFWTAFATMTAVLAARAIIPRLYPNTPLAHYLEAHVTLGLGDDADAD